MRASQGEDEVVTAIGRGDSFSPKLLYLHDWVTTEPIW
jgi:hypothetical protein